MTDGTPPDTSDVPDREELLSLLDGAMQEAAEKVRSGRVYDAEAERVRIKWIRVLSQVAGEYRKVLRDRDLEELNERLEALEEREGKQ